MSKSKPDLSYFEILSAEAFRLINARRKVHNGDGKTICNHVEDIKKATDLVVTQRLSSTSQQ